MEIKAELDPESLRKIISMAKQATPTLKREVYKEIRTAAQPAADAAKEAILGPPPPRLSQGRTWTNRRRPPSTRLPQHTGLREGIAAGVKVGLGSGAYTMGVRITSSSSGLKPSQYRMNRTYDKPSFRHPVFGHGSAKQAGKEWFFQPIRESRPRFTEGVKKAMNEASERLAAL